MVKLAAGALVLFLGVLFVVNLISGGDDSSSSALRPGVIPTATPPTNPPEPILLGESRGVSPGSSAGGAGTHLVLPGETLFVIANRFNVPAEEQATWVVEVLRLNGIADASLLQAGQELRLPARTAATATATLAPAATPTAVTGGGSTYTVVAGDSALLIAQKLGVPIGEREVWAAQLLTLNGVGETQLEIGQVLQLPAGTSQTAPP